jgi:Zn-dependent peptidase ImmA (M78 family)
MKVKLKKDASEFRNELGYGITDSVNLNSLLIKLDIIAVFKRLSNNFSGMAISISNPEKKFILINSDHSIGRQNFSICHELYHLYKDEDFHPHHSYAGAFDKKTRNEYYADIFASFFLLPEEGILSLIPDKQLPKDKITIDTILKIEHYFRCSRSALLYRLKELNIISSTYYDTYSQNVKVTAKLHGYSNDLYEPGNDGKVIGNYGSIAKSLYDEEKISEGHYISLMKDIGIDVFNDNNDDSAD